MLQWKGESNKLCFLLFPAPLGLGIDWCGMMCWWLYLAKHDKVNHKLIGRLPKLRNYVSNSTILWLLTRVLCPLSSQMSYIECLKANYLHGNDMSRNHYSTICFLIPCRLLQHLVSFTFIICNMLTRSSIKALNWAPISRIVLPVSLESPWNTIQYIMISQGSPKNILRSYWLQRWLIFPSIYPKCHIFWIPREELILLCFPFSNLIDLTN